METPANINVPIIERRQNDYASANSAFAGVSSLPMNWEVVKRGNEPSYRLVRRQIDLEEDSINYSPTNFAILKDSAETTTFDTDFNNSITKNLVNDQDEDFDDSLFYGVQVFEYPRKVLFTQEVEINTKELKRWKPDIIIEPFLLDDDE